MKDLGKAELIIGIRGHWRPDGLIFLWQCACVDNVLLCLNQAGGCPDPQLRTSPEDHELMASFHRHCMQAVGSLNVRPNVSHSSVVVHVCQYLKGISNSGIECTPDNAPLCGFAAYCNSKWGTCLDTSRSTRAVSSLYKLQPHI
ncbi:hypothetical protein JCM8547_003809, partial [Rhodosporidiobolus lusitaniae]